MTKRYGKHGRKCNNSNKNNEIKENRLSRGNQYQLIVNSVLRELTEPVVFVTEVAKQHGDSFSSTRECSP